MAELVGALLANAEDFGDVDQTEELSAGHPYLGSRAGYG